MTKVAVEHAFTGNTGLYSAGYDSTKTMLGQWIQQKTDSAGPAPLSIVRPFEGNTINPGFATVGVHAIDVGNNIHWVFWLEQSSAANNVRKIALATYNTATQIWNLKGTISVTWPNGATTSAITGRAIAVKRHLYTTGTVSGSSGSTTVTGVGTAWKTIGTGSNVGYAEGSRIGFGSHDPNAITQWYRIATMTSDTSVTLATALQNALPSGTSFVIEELRIYAVFSNVLATLSGLWVAKGIAFDDFTSAGTAIPSATSTDQQKAAYWLADASTVTNKQPAGLMLSATYSDSSHFVHVTDGASTSIRLYKYDVRAVLGSLSSGKSTSAFVYKSGAFSVSGNVQQNNAWTLATTSHGAGKGTSHIYGLTSTVLVRFPESWVDTTTAYAKDFVRPLPPLGSNAGAALGTLTAIKYIDTIDKFLVVAPPHIFLAKYQDGPFERALTCDTKQQDQLSANSGLYPNTGGSSTNIPFIHVLNGICYINKAGANAAVPTQALNQTYAFAVGADWGTAASSTYQNRLITPSLSTPKARRFYHLTVNHTTAFGTSPYDMPADPFRVYYRTSGITDNTGTWTPVLETGDLTGVGSTDNIQFMFEFKTAGHTLIPAKIYSLTCTYEDDTTDSHYQPSANLSNVSTKAFAWRFADAFGTTVPTLTIKIYESVTGTLLIKDTTAAQTYGTFQKSTDGGASWSSYNTTDKANNVTYIRYTPSILGDNMKVRVVLQQ